MARHASPCGMLAVLASAGGVLACSEAGDLPPLVADSDAQVHVGGGLSGGGVTGGGNGETSLEVTGGTYFRTYTSDADGGPTGEGDPAKVSSFRLDEDLVTVLRAHPLKRARSAYETGAGRRRSDRGRVMSLLSK